METPQAVSDARSNAASLGKTAADYAASAMTIPDQLKKSVQEALDYNKDVIGMRSTALADYQSAPAQANAKFGVQQFGTGPQAGQVNPDFIFNPFERNSAIQTFINNQGIPFNVANTLLGMRQGTVADTVDAGTRAFNSQATAAQAAALAARQTYEDVLNEYKTTTELNQSQQRINQTGSANGLDPALAALIKKLLEGDTTNGAGNSAVLAGVEEDQAQPTQNPTPGLTGVYGNNQANTSGGLTFSGKPMKLTFGQPKAVNL